MHLQLMGLSSEVTVFDTHLSDRLQGPIGDDLPVPGLVLFDRVLDLPVRCRLCGRCDRWLPENELVFVCEHEPAREVPWLRRIDSVRADRVIVEHR